MYRSIHLIRFLLPLLLFHQVSAVILSFCYLVPCTCFEMNFFDIFFSNKVINYHHYIVFDYLSESSILRYIPLISTATLFFQTENSTNSESKLIVFDVFDRLPHNLFLAYIIARIRSIFFFLISPCILGIVSSLFYFIFFVLEYYKTNWW